MSGDIGPSLVKGLTDCVQGFWPIGGTINERLGLHGMPPILTLARA